MPLSIGWPHQITVATVKVGLTGGLASGKSTLGRLLEAREITRLDADLLVAELYRTGGEGSRAVAHEFGPEMLLADGSVDRARLAATVFADPKALARLERTIHPLVSRLLDQRASAVAGPVVVEATRLVEAGMAHEVNGIVTVEAPESLRRERALLRGMNAQDVEARLAAQGDGKLRRQMAHFTVTNTGTLLDLEPAADAVAQWIRQLEHQVLSSSVADRRRRSARSPNR